MYKCSSLNTKIERKGAVLGYKNNTHASSKGEPAPSIMKCFWNRSTNYSILLSSKGGARFPLPWKGTILNDLFLMNRTWWRWQCVRLLRLDHKSLCLFLFPLSDRSFWGQSAAGHEGPQAALRRGLCGKELSPPANSQQGTEVSCQQPCQRTILKANHQFQSSLQMMAAQVNKSIAALWENMSQNHPTNLPWNFWPTENVTQ